MVPVLEFIPALASPLDHILRALLCAALVGLTVRPLSRTLIWLVLAGFAFLFLQDQNRIWPSFYEFFFLFFILAAYRREADAHSVMSGSRFVLAAVYFWSGFQKLNPNFYYSTFPWFFKPITDFLGIGIPGQPTVAMLAALAEASFGIGLLTKRFRALALFDAMAMHAAIFFLIGPFRGNWNDSAWIWNGATAALVWVLFYKAPPFQFRKMFAAPLLQRAPAGFAVVFIGVMPILNNINRWDSALSFNVYSGNVGTAYIRMQPEAARRLPRGLAPFLQYRAGSTILNINEWTAHDFNANPIAEKRILRAVFRTICGYTSHPSVKIVVREKSGWAIPSSTNVYGCGEL